jgi:tetratricopeptide (TPR) repeat protein
MSEAAANNPYDFRSPVRRRELLAGREGEIEQIDEFLREAASGKSSHFSLFGTSGMGKSSLLNAVAEVAKGRNLLPVLVELREATVESTVAFYAAIFDAVLGALIDADALEAGDPMMQTWSRHTLAGDTAAGLDGIPHLETGILVAAKMSGKVVDEVPAAVLKRDLATLLSIGSEHGIRGIVLEFDSAEQIDKNRDLAPSIMELVLMAQGLTLVTAAESAGELQKVAPRAWSQIEVGPFSRPAMIFDAIMRPLVDAEELDLAPSFSTAKDIQMLTEGRPYEVNLVSHFIWEAITQGEQSEFVLSKAVIERVLHELEERGRHEASTAIADIRNLSSTDLEAVALLAPFEGLTIRQLALGRLMLDDYDEERLREVENDVSDELRRLSQAGIVELSHDLFELRGGPEARLYLRYVAEQRVEKKIEYKDTYARLATGVCRERLSDELLGSGNLNKLLRGWWSKREVGNLVSGRWVEQLAESIVEQNLSAMNELLPGFDDEETLAEFAEKGGLLFGFTLQVGLQSVEYADVAINLEELSGAEARERVEAWIEDNGELLAKYEISFEIFRCEVIPPPLAKAAAAYSELHRYCSLVVFLHRAGFIAGAIEELTHCINKCEALIGADPTDPLLRAELADALNRVGFMQATEERWKEAEANLKRSLEFSLAEEWLTVFNLSYVKANQGEFAEALSFAQEAVKSASPGDVPLILHAWFPAPDNFQSEAARPSVISVQGGWVERFIELQAAVYAAQEDARTRERQVKSLLDGLSQSSPPALLRLAGWAELTIMERHERAVDLFERALNVTALDEMAAVSSEIAYAKARVPNVPGDLAKAEA